MRKLTLVPATTGVLEITVFCAMRTSAPGSTVVFTVAVLSAVSGSATPPVAGATVALLVTMPPLAFTVPTMVIAGAEAPTARVPLRLQVTTPVSWSQVQPLPLAET